MRALIPEHEREPLPPAFLDGAWINAQPSPALKHLQGSPTLIIRFQATDPATTASLRYAQTHAPPNGAKALGLHVPEEAYEAKHRTVRNTVLREGLTVPIRQDSGGMRAKALSLHEPGDILILDARARIAARPPGASRKDMLALTRELKPSRSPEPDWQVRGHAPPPTPLLYPQGLATHDATLAIADTAHHRILHQRDGELRSFGTGSPGHQDGTWREACFLRPRGVLIQEDAIIVADTGNGALRRIHPDEGTVDTIVGEQDLGKEQADGPFGPMPRDLAAHPHEEGIVVASLTGEGRLVSVDLEEGTVRSMATTTGLSRPAGIASSDASIFVSDPWEGHIVRVDPQSGDSEVLLADDEDVVSPAGLAYAGGVLVIVDPFGGALHRFDVDGERLIETVASFGPADPLVEPWAVAVWEEGVLTVGDEHRLVETDASGSRWVPSLEDRLGDPGIWRLDPVEVAPGGRLRLDVVLRGEGSSPRGAPRVRGPVRVGAVDAGEKRGGALWSGVEVEVLASGRVEVSWGQRAAWSLPVLVRPGGRGVERVQVSGWDGTGPDEEQSP